MTVAARRILLPYARAGGSSAHSYSKPVCPSASLTLTTHQIEHCCYCSNLPLTPPNSTVSTIELRQHRGSTARWTLSLPCCHSAIQTRVWTFLATQHRASPPTLVARQPMSLSHFDTNSLLVPPRLPQAIKQIHHRPFPPSCPPRIRVREKVAMQATGTRTPTTMRSKATHRS